jgi:uncharacterized membrane-anchored protein
MNEVARVTLSKVPEVTLAFWVIKIAATTLGETGGDALSMSLQFGYAVSSIIFIVIFVVAVAAQISAKSFHPFLTPLLDAPSELGSAFPVSGVLSIR